MFTRRRTISRSGVAGVTRGVGAPLGRLDGSVPLFRDADGQGLQRFFVHFSRRSFTGWRIKRFFFSML